MRMDSRSVKSTISSSHGKKDKKEKRRRPKRTVVRFSGDEPEIHTIPSTSTLTRDEIENSWFSIDELMIIREQVQAQQRLAELGAYDMKIREYDDYLCMRGIQLESETLERKFYYNEALKALLNEQEQQLFAKINDPEMIRTVVQFWTKKASEEAILIAKSDREEVERLESIGSGESVSNASRVYEESRNLLLHNASIFLPSPTKESGNKQGRNNDFDLAAIVGDALSTLETDIL